MQRQRTKIAARLCQISEHQFDYLRKRRRGEPFERGSALHRILQLGDAAGQTFVAPTSDRTARFSAFDQCFPRQFVGCQDTRQFRRPHDFLRGNGGCFNDGKIHTAGLGQALSARDRITIEPQRCLTQMDAQTQPRLGMKRFPARQQRIDLREFALMLPQQTAVVKMFVGSRHQAGDHHLAIVGQREAFGELGGGLSVQRRE